MLVIDGSQGEGGGQILRSSLALSLVTGQPFCIDKIRANRSKPGLLRQHLTAVRAAAEVGRAEVSGAELCSPQLRFHPGTITAGDYHFAVGTAGSATLVLQTVLPALLTAAGPSRLILEGGTHNPWAPPFDFLERSFLPLINRMGPSVTARLERPGFYPAGGGRFEVAITPADRLQPLQLLERGEIRRRQATARVAGIPRSVADREIKAVRDLLSLSREQLHTEVISNSIGPGNVLLIEFESEAVSEVFCGFGRRRMPAETVAEETVREARRYLAAPVPVGTHLADQLLLPLALSGGGAFCTLAPTQHTLTNIAVIQRFMNISIEIHKQARDCWRVDIKRSET